MFHSGDDINAIVADIGSYSCRIGYAGDDTPRANFPTNVGKLAHRSSNDADDIIFSPNKYRDSMDIVSPVMDGVVVDWDLLEKLWTYSLSNYLKTDLRGLPVLVAEKPFTAPSTRRKMTELMFEKFQSSAFFLSKDAVLSCYSVGKTSGLVVDCGGGGTVVTPVVDGWIELKGISRSNLSGRLMDAYMLALVTKKLKTMPKPLYRLQKTVITERNNELQVADNPALANVTRSFQSYMNLELGRDIKEAVCKVTDQPLVENELRYSSLPTTSYELPDGTIIDLGIERFSVPELFLDSSPLQAASSSSTSSSSPSSAMLLGQAAPSFNPLELVQEETAGLHSATLALAAARSQSAAPSLPFSLDSVPKMACDSVFRSDQDSQNTLLANMVLTGGNSSYDGLLERIRFEVERRIHLQAPGIKVKMVSSGNTERSISSWLGGSIVGSLGSFHEIWINRKEYEEFGAHIVDRKCP